MKLPWRFQRPKYIPPSWIPLPELCPTPWTPTRYYPSEIKMFLRYTLPSSPFKSLAFLHQEAMEASTFRSSRSRAQIRPLPWPRSDQIDPDIYSPLGLSLLRNFSILGNIYIYIYIYRVWRACRNNWYDEFLISSIHVQVIWIERLFLNLFSSTEDGVVLNIDIYSWVKFVEDYYYCTGGI